MKAMRFAFVMLVPLLLVPLVSVAGEVAKDDMSDIFAPVDLKGARGFVKTETVQRGAIRIKQVHVKGLAPGEYEVFVNVGTAGVDCNPNNFGGAGSASSAPIMVGQGGGLSLKDFFVGSFSPGTYRVDILVVPVGNGIGGPFLAACQPFPCVTVK